MNIEKEEKTEKIFQTIATKTSFYLEIIMAIFVLIGVVISIWYMIPQVGELMEAQGGTDVFMEYLEGIFTVVIGIEFLKMLCRPTSENVLETMIFLIARHMVINQATPMDDFISVITIILLAFAKRILRHKRNGNQIFSGFPLVGKKEKNEEQA